MVCALAACSLLAGDLVLDVLLQLLDLLLEFGLLAAKILILSLQGLDIGVGGGTKALLDELNSIAGLLGLLVKANKDLGEVVDDASTLKVLSEFFFLLVSWPCLLSFIVNVLSS